MYFFMIYNVVHSHDSVLRSPSHSISTCVMNFFVYLRFRVVADGLVDESADPPLEAGVSQLIEQRQLEHQDRFLQTQGHRTIAQSLYNEQERLRREMSDRLSLLKQDQRYSLIR